jgi:hypothetical protein
MNRSYTLSTRGSVAVPTVADANATSSPAALASSPTTRS